MLRGVKICPSVPSINHLLFANDSLVFCEASVQEVQTLCDVLHCYKSSSGQYINRAKSGVFFTFNVPNALRVDIMNGLQINQVSSGERYLGLLLFIRRNKKKEFRILKDQI